MGAELHLYSAVQMPPVFVAGEGHFNPVGYADSAKVFRREIDDEVSRLAKMVKDAGVNCTVNIEDQSSSLGKQISDFANEKGIWNWVVVATRRRSHLSRWALGSVAHDVAHRSLNPTLFIPHRVLNEDLKRESVKEAC